MKKNIIIIILSVLLFLLLLFTGLMFNYYEKYKAHQNEHIEHLEKELKATIEQYEAIIQTDSTINN